MSPLLTSLLLVWTHFVADFLLQTDNMALNKSTNHRWLGLHALTYTVPFLLFGFKFAVANGVAHFVVDFITSRCTRNLWDKGERFWFFNFVGMDQAVHLTTLFSTYALFHR